MLKLGIGRRIITPAVGGHLYGYDPILCSKSKHDDLTATAFVLSDGENECVLISATVCLINTKLSDEIREAVEKDTGIKRENVILSATHTHSGPNVSGETGWGDIDREYCDSIFIPKIREAVKEASDNRRTVTVGMARGNSNVGINRRELDSENRVCLGQCLWGSYNPKMSVISFRDEKGETVGNIIHYGAHGTAAGYCDEISRDWPGIMTDTLESMTGGITAFFNGPEGDVGPRLSNGQTTGNMTYVHELGNKAAEDAVRIYRSIKGFKPLPLHCREGKLSIPLMKRIPLEKAESELKKYESKTVNIGGQKAQYYRSVIESYKNGFEDREFLEVKQNVVKLGDTVIVTFPYELFSEIGMRAEKMSEYDDVLSFAMTNGAFGYFVTEDQIMRGGYEVDMYLTSKLQPYAEHADWYMAKETARNIGGKQ